MFLISRVPIRGNYALIDLFGIKMSPSTCLHVGMQLSYFYSSTQSCGLWEFGRLLNFRDEKHQMVVVYFSYAQLTIFFSNQYFKLTKNIESWIHLNPGRINSQLLPGTVTDARDIKGETDRRSEGQRHLHLTNSHYRVSLRLFWTTDWSSVPEPEPKNSLGYRWKVGPCWPGVTPWVQFDSAVWGSVGGVAYKDEPRGAIGHSSALGSC